MLRSALLVSLLAFSAAASAEGFNYSYAYFGYGNTDWDTIDADGSGFSVGGSYGFSDNIHGFISYDTAELDPGAGFPDVDADRTSIGVGYNKAMSNAIDGYARFSYESVDFDIPGFGSADDSGFGLAAGLRFRATEELELGAGVTYVDYDDLGDDTGIELNGIYSFENSWALALNAELSDDVTTYMLSGRFYFGN